MKGFIQKVTSTLHLKSGEMALQACGMQPEFARHLMMQAAVDDTCIILRAGNPPVYNQRRGSKSGVNLSKTSNHGLFRGSLAADLQFTRVDKKGHNIGWYEPMLMQPDSVLEKNKIYFELNDGSLQYTVISPNGNSQTALIDKDKLTFEPTQPLSLEQIKRLLPEILKITAQRDHTVGYGHHKKDAAHLALPPNHIDYQHCMQLVITMQDLIREVRPEGDLNVLGYDQNSGQLRLEYKPGKGPVDFMGQFVLNLKEGDKTPQFFSRPWDKAQYDPEWDRKKRVIKKPEALAAIPDEEYKRIFNQLFKVYYTVTKQTDLAAQDLIAAKVMANKPRTAVEFLEAMGADHPRYSEVSAFTKLSDILDQLKPEEILAIYDKHSLIVTGDWDGLSLGHPPSLKPEYAQVYNTFNMEDAHLGMEALMVKTSEYLECLKANALAKDDNARSEFEKVILTIEKLTDIISDFALERAGCITPYEFLYQQVINYSYRTPTNAFYGKKYDMQGMQDVMDKTLKIVNDPVRKYNSREKEDLIAVCMKQSEDILKKRGRGLSYIQMQKTLDHFRMHLRTAISLGVLHYDIPHPDHDPNVHDLFQHGFDNNNPYGCNYEGAWILVTPEGVIYGETQEQLCKVMLKDNFLRDNIITVNWGADMSAGWAKVIETQLKFGQIIPPQTMEKYESYQKSRVSQTASQKKAPSIETETEVKGSAESNLSSKSKPTSQYSSSVPGEFVTRKNPLSGQEQQKHHRVPPLMESSVVKIIGQSSSPESLQQYWGKKRVLPPLKHRDAPQAALPTGESCSQSKQRLDTFKQAAQVECDPPSVDENKEPPKNFRR